jgi:hypothetical protein
MIRKGFVIKDKWGRPGEINILPKNPNWISGNYEFLVPVVVLPAEDVEEVKFLLTGITCLAFEGPEVVKHLDLFNSICKEAQKSLAILEGQK